MDETFLTNKIDENIKLISSMAPTNSNFINREMLLAGEVRCNLFYINGLVNRVYIEDSIIKPLLFRVDVNINEIEKPYEYIAKHYLIISSIVFSRDLTNISEELRNGKTIILIENTEYAVICDTTGGTYRAIQESTTEKSVRGPKEAFVENLETNISLIQRKIRSNNLKIENYVIGYDTGTNVCLIYMDNKISKEVINTIKNKLTSIKTPSILASGNIEQLIEEKPYNIFPRIKSTDKSTKVISDILEGKAAILIDGTPFALVAPAVFIEFFQGAEDYMENSIVSSFARIIRNWAVFIVITAAPLYLVLIIYNVELLPFELTKVIVDSRIGIPIPPLLEILLMEIVVEFLREGGLRLPVPVGQSLSIVGGIVLGDSAVKANIVSPTTLFVIVFAVIATFLIPNYEMSLSIRLIRFPMLVLAQLFGFLGIIIGLLFILTTLIRMESFGIPYLTPLAPLRYRDLWDTIISFPLSKRNKQPESFKPSRFRRGSNDKG